MKRQIIIIFATMLLITILGRAEGLQPPRPTQSSGPRNYEISPYQQTFLDIDIDEDGIMDLSFSSSFNITADNPTSMGAGSVSINTRDNYVLSDGHYALPGNIIGSTNVWEKGSSSISSFSVNYIQGTSTGWTGPWSDVDIGYLSVLFKDSSNLLHSASIRLLVPDGGPMSMFVMDWFYEIDPLLEPTSAGTAVLSSGNELQLSFSGVRNGLQYVLEHSTNLAEGTWSTNSILTATSDTLSMTNSITSQTGYWRLKQIP